MNETKFYNEFCIKYDLDPKNPSLDVVLGMLKAYKTQEVETLEKRIKELTECQECEEGYIDAICGSCSGSGEGMADGTTCRRCKGRGENRYECEHCKRT